MLPDPQRRHSPILTRRGGLHWPGMELSESVTVGLGFLGVETGDLLRYNVKFPIPSQAQEYGKPVCIKVVESSR